MEIKKDLTTPSKGILQNNDSEYVRLVSLISDVWEKAREEAVLAAWILNKKDPLAEAIKELAENPKVQVNVQPGATAQITEQGINNSYLRIPQ